KVFSIFTGLVSHSVYFSVRRAGTEYINKLFIKEGIYEISKNLNGRAGDPLRAGGMYSWKRLKVPVL
ncbi:MAG: hypothetical protein LUE19_01710, partial [Clostridiales bacterium]|nr:hypothetical protein [Clostridiales bacterium]